jgi:hypothetical protein
MIYNKFDAILKLVGGRISGNSDGTNISYDDGQTPPSDSEIDNEIIRLQTEYDAQAYARDRASAYDSIGNQLDMIYKDNLNGTTTHKASVEAVKAKYPKPS